MIPLSSPMLVLLAVVVHGIASSVSAQSVPTEPPGTPAPETPRPAAPSSRKPLSLADLKAKRQPPRPSARELFFQGKLILNGKNGFTVIPEGGVLRLPKAHQARVAAKQPEGPLQPWPVFLQENRDWLGAEEVPLSVARGVPSLLDPVLARLAGEKRVIVSTYRKEPIGIMHPAEDEAPDPPAAQKP